MAVLLSSHREQSFYPGRENTIFDLRSTDDRFVIVVEAVSPDGSDAENAGNLMIENGASEVVEKKIEKVIT